MTKIIRKLLGFLRRLFGGDQSALPTTETPTTGDEEDEAVTDPVVPRDPITKEKPAMEVRPLLQRGDIGEDVKELQSLMNKNGFKLTVDGDFGGGTQGALESLQKSYGVEVSGEADLATWTILDRPLFSRDPKYKGLSLEPDARVGGDSAVAKGWNSYGGLLTILAQELGIKPSVAVAVLAVESAGEGFSDGRMVIRFENHIFESRRSPEKVPNDIFVKHFRRGSSQAWKGHQWRPDGSDWRTQHTASAGQSGEWEVFEFACTLDREAAIKSISMGAPQIMGFNFSKIGYASPSEMFDIFSQGDREHVLGLFDFFRSDHRMVRGLRSEDFVLFASIYNGPGQAEHYGANIKDKTRAVRELGIS